MELLKIDNDKLKITLTREDMAKYSLDFDKFSYDNTETRRAFWTILDDAKHETGFDAAIDTVSVQVYGSEYGGCEMYVTRVSDSDVRQRGCRAKSGSADSRLPMSLPDGNERALTDRKAVSEKTIYGFRSIEDMLSACKLLDSLKYIGESTAYFDKSGYYLTVSDGFARSYQRIRLSDMLSEFGMALSPMFIGYISEHAIPISVGHAVGLLSKLAL